MRFFFIEDGHVVTVDDRPVVAMRPEELCEVIDTLAEQVCVLQEMIKLGQTNIAPSELN